MIGEPPDHLVVVATPGVHEPRVRRFGPSPPVRTSEVTPNRRTRWPARPVGVVVGRIAGAHFYHGVSAGIGTRRATTPRGRRRQTRSTSSFERRRSAVVTRRTPQSSSMRASCRRFSANNAADGAPCASRHDAALARTGLDPGRDCVEVGAEPERRVGDQETLERSEPGEAVGHRAVERGDRHPTPPRPMPRRQCREVADQARTSRAVGSHGLDHVGPVRWPPGGVTPGMDE